ncbi:MAG TPA: hypothetical protein QF353_00015 [Gammaproteobacteria bacterium]|nr:hypothetical protein [Gammaproteobacteria bacterium]
MIYSNAASFLDFFSEAFDIKIDSTFLEEKKKDLDSFFNLETKALKQLTENQTISKDDFDAEVSNLRVDTISKVRSALCEKWVKVNEGIQPKLISYVVFHSRLSNQESLNLLQSLFETNLTDTTLDLPGRKKFLVKVNNLLVKYPRDNDLHNTICSVLKRVFLSLVNRLLDKEFLKRSDIKISLNEVLELCVSIPSLDLDVFHLVQKPIGKYLDTSFSQSNYLECVAIIKLIAEKSLSKEYKYGFLETILDSAWLCYWAGQVFAKNIYGLFVYLNQQDCLPPKWQGHQLIHYLYKNSVALSEAGVSNQQEEGWFFLDVFDKDEQQWKNIFHETESLLPGQENFLVLRMKYLLEKRQGFIKEEDINWVWDKIKDKGYTIGGSNDPSNVILNFPPKDIGDYLDQWGSCLMDALQKLDYKDSLRRHVEQKLVKGFRVIFNNTTDFEHFTKCDYLMPMAHLNGFSYEVWFWVNCHLKNEKEKELFINNEWNYSLFEKIFTVLGTVVSVYLALTYLPVLILELLVVGVGSFSYFYSDFRQMLSSSFDRFLRPLPTGGWFKELDALFSPEGGDSLTPVEASKLKKRSPSRKEEISRLEPFQLETKKYTSI